MTILAGNVTTAISFFAARVGTAYDYGGMFSPTNTSCGTDCSGMVDTILHILTTGGGGPVDANGRFIRTVDTESWPYNYPTDLAVAVGTVGPYGTICAGDAQPGPPPTVYPPQIPSDAAAVIYLMHGGGGEDSHVMIAVNGIVMETGGDHNDTGGDGQYQSPNGPATSTTDPEWTDIWYLPGPIGNPPPPPTPTPGGFLMALTDAQQQQLFNAVCGPVASQSPFRALGEGAVWQEAQIVLNDDSFEHPQYVEWAALRGDPISLAVLTTLAAADVTVYPDRIEDIRLAQQTLARVQAALSGPVPPVPAPTPAPTPAPPAPAPTPIPPAPAPTPITISTAQLLQWGKEALTILGAVGTWATAVHSALGQYLPGQSAAIVPAAIAAATAGLTAHTVREKRVTQKQLVAATTAWTSAELKLKGTH